MIVYIDVCFIMYFYADILHILPFQGQHFSIKLCCSLEKILVMKLMIDIDGINIPW